MTVPPPPPPSQPYGQQPAAMVVPRFYVKQRITMMINRYEIRAANPDGSEGQLLARTRACCGRSSGFSSCR
jgi:hypothetical protein